MTKKARGSGRNLSAEIRRVSGETVRGRYSRYKAKKWQWLGDSGVATLSGRDTLGVYAADFRDKFDTPYTFVVAVDLTARVITPLEDLPEVQRDAVGDWLEAPPPAKPVPSPSPGGPKRDETRFSIWLGEVHVPSHPMMPNPKVPRLLLGSSADDPIARINKLNAGSVKGSGFTRRHPITPRLDLLEAMPRHIRGPATYQKLKDVRRRKAKIRDHLREEGFVVDLSNGNVVYTVYVINLSDEVGLRVGRNRWVYVGETSKTPEERHKEHLAGYKASKWVKNYGQDLNYGLFSRAVPQVRFRQDALVIESQLATDLEGRGFNVKGGH